MSFRFQFWNQKKTEYKTGGNYFYASEDEEEEENEDWRRSEKRTKKTARVINGGDETGSLEEQLERAKAESKFADLDFITKTLDNTLLKKKLDLAETNLEKYRQWQKIEEDKSAKRDELLPDYDVGVMMGNLEERKSVVPIRNELKESDNELKQAKTRATFASQEVTRLELEIQKKVKELELNEKLKKDKEDQRLMPPPPNQKPRSALKPEKKRQKQLETYKAELEKTQKALETSIIKAKEAETPEVVETIRAKIDQLKEKMTDKQNLLREIYYAEKNKPVPDQKSKNDNDLRLRIEKDPQLLEAKTIFSALYRTMEELVEKNRRLQEIKDKDRKESEKKEKQLAAIKSNEELEQKKQKEDPQLISPPDQKQRSQQPAKAAEVLPAKSKRTILSKKPISFEKIRETNQEILNELKKQRDKDNKAAKEKEAKKEKLSDQDNDWASVEEEIQDFYQDPNENHKKVPPRYEGFEEEKKTLIVDTSKVWQIGKGLFAKGPRHKVIFLKGDVIAKYEGKTLTLDQLNQKYPGEDKVAVYAIQNSEDLFIDANKVKSDEPGWFAKHANDCTPSLNRFSVSQLKPGCKKNNAEFEEFDEFDDKKTKKIGTYLVALQDIKSGEEIWASYGGVYFKEPKEDLPLTAKQKQKINKLRSYELQTKRETRIRAATRSAHYKNSIAMELIKEVLMKDYIQSESSSFKRPSWIAEKVRSQMEIALGKRVMNPEKEVRKALDAFSSPQSGYDKEENEFEKTKLEYGDEDEDELKESKEKKKRTSVLYRVKPIIDSTFRDMFESLENKGIGRTEKKIVEDIQLKHRDRKEKIPPTIGRDVRTILEYFPQLYTASTKEDNYYYKFDIDSTDEKKKRYEKLSSIVKNDSDKEWMALTATIAQKPGPKDLNRLLNATNKNSEEDIFVIIQKILEEGKQSLNKISSSLKRGIMLDERYKGFQKDIQTLLERRGDYYEIERIGKSYQRKKKAKAKNRPALPPPASAVERKQFPTRLENALQKDEQWILKDITRYSVDSRSGLRSLQDIRKVLSRFLPDKTNYTGMGEDFTQFEDDIQKLIDRHSGEIEKIGNAYKSIEWKPLPEKTAEKKKTKKPKPNLRKTFKTKRETLLQMNDNEILSIINNYLEGKGEQSLTQIHNMLDRLRPKKTNTYKDFKNDIEALINENANMIEKVGINYRKKQAEIKKANNDTSAPGSDLKLLNRIINVFLSESENKEDVVYKTGKEIAEALGISAQDPNRFLKTQTVLNEMKRNIGKSFIEESKNVVAKHYTLNFENKIVREAQTNRSRQIKESIAQIFNTNKTVTLQTIVDLFKNQHPEITVTKENIIELLNNKNVFPHVSEISQGTYSEMNNDLSANKQQSDLKTENEKQAKIEKLIQQYVQGKLFVEAKIVVEDFKQKHPEITVTEDNIIKLLDDKTKFPGLQPVEFGFYSNSNGSEQGPLVDKIKKVFLNAFQDNKFVLSVKELEEKLPQFDPKTILDTLDSQMDKSFFKTKKGSWYLNQHNFYSELKEILSPQIKTILEQGPKKVDEIYSALRTNVFIRTIEYTLNKDAIFVKEANGKWRLSDEEQINPLPSDPPSKPQLQIDFKAFEEWMVKYIKDQGESAPTGEQIVNKIIQEYFKKDIKQGDPTYQQVQEMVDKVLAQSTRIEEIEEKPAFSSSSSSSSSSGGSSHSKSHSIKSQIIHYLSKKNLSFEKRSFDDIYRYVFSKIPNPDSNLKQSILLTLQNKEFFQTSGKWFYQP